MRLSYTGHNSTLFCTQQLDPVNAERTVYPRPLTRCRISMITATTRTI
jgi:hypothetical protein